jgi:hypothetical protein
VCTHEKERDRERGHIGGVRRRSVIGGAVADSVSERDIERKLERERERERERELRDGERELLFF